MTDETPGPASGVPGDTSVASDDPPVQPGEPPAGARRGEPPAGARPDEPPVFSSDDEPTPTAQRARSRRRGRRVLPVLVGLLAAVVLAAGWLVFQVYRAGTALADAQDRVNVVVTLLDGGDLSGVADALPDLRADLGRARSAASDPVWSAALVVPWLGDQLGAVRTVAVALDDVAAAGEPLVNAAATMLAPSGDRAVDGTGLDLGPLVAAAPEVAAAAEGIEDAAAAVAAIDPDGLVGPLAGPVTTVQEEFPRVADGLGSARRIAGILPGLLGADGPRTYAVALLNSAELRAQGGIVGSIAVLRAEDGRLALVEQHSGSGFGVLDAPVVPLTDEELALHGDRLGRWLQDASEVPDFPRTGELVAARWAHETGEQVDGVIATDTPVVSDLLKATGPVTVDGVELDSATVVDQLLSETYARLTDPAEADAFFAHVADAVFGAVAAGQGDRTRVVTALARAVGEGRLHVWSAHDDEEPVLAGEAFGGAFLSGDSADAAGVFLDDGTASKLGYYLRTGLSVEDMHCAGDAPSATVRLDLEFRAPDDLAALPEYVVGVPDGAEVPRQLQTNVSVYAPVGATLTALGLDDGYVGGEPHQVAGRDVEVVTSWLAPGQHQTYRIEVPVRDGRVTVYATPTLTSPGVLAATCPAD